MQRHRPLVLLAEQGLSLQDAQDRVRWEAAVRRGRSREIDVTVHGWREKRAGPLWAPGRIVPLHDDWLGIDQDLLITSVEQRIDSGGTITSLTLMPESAFDPEPQVTASETTTAEETPKKSSGYWE